MSDSCNEIDGDYAHIPIAAGILGSNLLASPPPRRSLRVCCYGSSSSQTPDRYMQEARHVGYLLAQRGHVCVNGAGSFGCMAAMNDGACKGNGHIVGVIHEMWLIDGEDSGQEASTWNGLPVRDGGAHGAFSRGTPKGREGPIREMLVAGGTDLQERKRLLMEGADALLVLPGGPGTWDELWEATCARGIGLSQIPIVVVNIDGYYDPFLRMMERAYAEGLTKLKPDQLIHFEDSAEGAVRWIETIQGEEDPHAHPKPRESRTVIRKSSVMTIPTLGHSDSWFFGSLRRSLSRINGSGTDDQLPRIAEEEDNDSGPPRATWPEACTFALGVLVGATAFRLITKPKSNS